MVAPIAAFLVAELVALRGSNFVPPFLNVKFLGLVAIGGTYTVNVLFVFIEQDLTIEGQRFGLILLAVAWLVLGVSPPIVNELPSRRGQYIVVTFLMVLLALSMFAGAHWVSDDEWVREVAQ